MVFSALFLLFSLFFVLFRRGDAYIYRECVMFTFYTCWDKRVKFGYSGTELVYGVFMGTLSILSTFIIGNNSSIYKLLSLIHCKVWVYEFWVSVRYSDLWSSHSLSCCHISIFSSIGNHIQNLTPPWVSPPYQSEIPRVCLKDTVYTSHREERRGPSLKTSYRSALLYALFLVVA